MIDDTYIFKKDIPKFEYFESLVGLHNCIYMLDDDIYIIEGSPEDIEAFRQDWIRYKESLYNG